MPGDDMPCKDLSALDGRIPGDAGWRSTVRAMRAHSSNITYDDNDELPPETYQACKIKYPDRNERDRNEGTYLSRAHLLRKRHEINPPATVKAAMIIYPEK